MELPHTFFSSSSLLPVFLPHSFLQDLAAQHPDLPLAVDACMWSANVQHPDGVLRAWHPWICGSDWWAATAPALCSAVACCSVSRCGGG